MAWPGNGHSSIARRTCACRSLSICIARFVQPSLVLKPKTTCAKSGNRTVCGGTSSTRSLSKPDNNRVLIKNPARALRSENRHALNGWLFVFLRFFFFLFLLLSFFFLAFLRVSNRPQPLAQPFF